MCLTKMTLKAFIFLSAFSMISCQTEMQEGRATIVKNVSPYTEEISTSIIEATEGVTQLAEAASENILEGTKELVENASSSLKEAGEKLAGEEEQKDLTSALSSDDGTLDLSQFSFEQQKIDRDEAAAFILEVREKRIIIQPGDIPDRRGRKRVPVRRRESRPHERPEADPRRTSHDPDPRQRGDHCGGRRLVRR